MNLIKDTLGAITIVCLLLLGPALDHFDAFGHGSARPSATQLQAQAEASAALRRELAAQKLCAADAGPNSGYRWAADGALICTTKHGRATGTVKVGAL